MNTKITSAALAALVAASVFGEPLDDVRATTGTINSFELSAGNVYPAICRPWGGPMWAPVTKPGHREGWFYDYTGTRFYGMRLTHQPSPWMNDFGQITVTPIVGSAGEKMDDRRSHFTHKSETVRPDYYKVYLGDYDILFELTAAKRACVMRITYGDSNSPGFVVDAMGGSGKVEVDRANRRIYGVSTQRSQPVANDFGNRFVVEFDRDIVSVEDKGSWCCVRFAPTKRGDVVTARMASSFVDREYAVANLEEVAKGFDAVHEESTKTWNAVLGRFQIETPDVDRRRMFYTALYRASLFPRAYFDIDPKTKKAVHRSPTPGGVFEGPFYAGTGFWDTFRALFPLLNFAFPEVNSLMTEGLQNSWKEAGWYPEWSSPGLSDCMTGNNSASVIADAWLSGARGKADAETLWQGLVHGANNQHPRQGATGRWGAADYNSLGYVAHDRGRHGTVARTLEYAYDDWCIWKFGLAIGKSKEDVEQYRRHAGNWRNVIDPQRKLANGRWRDGKFRDDFNPIKWGDGDFVEGNSLHWTWSVFHDIAGLMDVMGGRAAFAAALDDVLARRPEICESDRRGMYHEMREMQLANFGQYAHGNQPAQHMLYLYNWCGEPWKSQYWVREAMDRLYSPTPDGYCGDEDNGQTSAWYVWSTLGFYPVCPGSGQYVIGSPAVERATLKMPGGGTLVIEAPGAAKNRYIASVTLNGRPVKANWLPVSELKKGGKLVFKMSETPVKTRGTDEAAAPYSMSRNEK